MGGKQPAIFIEAQYSDGFVYRETKEDKSAFVPGKSFFFDIVERLPEQRHGPMQKFSLVRPPTDRIEVDFMKLPVGALPVRLKHMEGDLLADGRVAPRLLQIEFGWELLDKEGNRIDGEIMPVL